MLAFGRTLIYVVEIEIEIRTWLVLIDGAQLQCIDTVCSSDTSGDYERRRQYGVS